MMIRWLVVAVVSIVVLSGCAAGPNPHMDTPRDSPEEPGGFLLGLWHGAIILPAFVVSLFRSSVGVYEVYNSGWSYDLGFLIGILVICGGGSGGACRRQSACKSDGED